jgi:hypothetical protein
MLSCATTPVSITSSNTPLNDKKIAENLGKVEGKGNLTVSIFGLWMVQKPDIQSAIDDALYKKKADALINIKCYEEWQYYFFISFTRVIVEGEAVKFQIPSEQNVEPY